MNMPKRKPCYPDGHHISNMHNDIINECVPHTMTAIPCIRISSLHVERYGL